MKSGLQVWSDLQMLSDLWSLVCKCGLIYKCGREDFQFQSNVFVGLNIFELNFLKIILENDLQNLQSEFLEVSKFAVVNLFTGNKLLLILP